MGQITIYLDSETEQRLRTAASEAGVPVSRWLAALLREQLRDNWPAAVREMPGAWEDFPDAEALREDSAGDVPREPL